MTKVIALVLLTLLFVTLCDGAPGARRGSKVIVATGPVQVSRAPPTEGGGAHVKLAAEGAETKMAEAVEEAVAAKLQREQEEAVVRASQGVHARNQEAHWRDKVIQAATKRRDDALRGEERLEHREAMQAERDKEREIVAEHKREELKEEEKAKIDALKRQKADLEVAEERLMDVEAREKEKVKEIEENDKIKVENAKKKEQHDIQDAIMKAEAASPRFAEKSKGHSVRRRMTLA